MRFTNAPHIRFVKEQWVLDQGDISRIARNQRASTPKRRGAMVEATGFEPATLGLQSRCSPS